MIPSFAFTTTTQKVDSTKKLKNQTDQYDDTVSEGNTEEKIKEKKETEMNLMIQSLTKPLKVPNNHSNSNSKNQSTKRKYYLEFNQILLSHNFPI